MPLQRERPRTTVRFARSVERDSNRLASRNCLRRQPLRLLLLPAGRGFHLAKDFWRRQLVGHHIRCPRPCSRPWYQPGSLSHANRYAKSDKIVAQAGFSNLGRTQAAPSLTPRNSETREFLYKKTLSLKTVGEWEPW